MAQPMASPTTPIARKAPMESTPTKSRMPASGQKQKRKPKIDVSPSASVQKRKVKTENATPTKATPKGKGTGARNPQNKKQKVAHNDEKELADEIYLPIENKPRLNLPTPFQTPIGSPSPFLSMPPQQQHQQQYQHQHPHPHQQQQQCLQNSPNVCHEEAQAAANGSQQSNHSQVIAQPTSQLSFKYSNVGPEHFDKLIANLYRMSPDMLPQIDAEAVSGASIDQHTYKIWQYCLITNNGMLHERANLYGALLNELKLRTLAKLNLLPSWWFVRTRIVEFLHARGYAIDDGVMDTQFKQAEVEMKNMIDKTKRLAE